MHAFRGAFGGMCHFYFVVFKNLCALCWAWIALGERSCIPGSGEPSEVVELEVDI